MKKELIVMAQKELEKYEVIKKLIAKEIGIGDAAKLINCTSRHARRLRSKVRRDGAKGVIHGLRGKESNNKTDSKIWAEAKEIILEKYSDFGPTLAHEKITEIEGIKISEQTTRNLMIAENIWRPKPRKQNKEYRCQRERKECFGELEQFDGCYHNWFEARSGENCLLAAIDDATGKITKLVFAGSESVVNVFKFWKSYVEELGKPVAIYLDKYSTYKINHKAAVDNSELLTQFQRAMNELGVNLITAHSPEAKGRVERLFQTLQDRLVKELRLRNISDIETANRFLKDEFIPDFNQRFEVVPKKKNDLHRNLSDIQRSNLDAIFSAQSERLVQNDFTVKFKNQWIQITKEQIITVRRADKVLVEERLDGSLEIRLRGKYLNFRILVAKPQKIREIIFAIPAKRTAVRPEINHPWRRQIAAEIAKLHS